MLYCGRVGLLLSLAPWELCQYYNPWNENTAHWFRWTGQDLDSDSCFGQLNFDMDSLVAVMSAEDMTDTLVDKSLASTVQDVASVMDTIPALWFYNVYDEAGGWQRRRMLDYTSTWDDYIPNIFTQDRDPITNIPTLAEVDPSGIFSWTKWLAENNTVHPVPLTGNLVLIHSIGSGEYSTWGGNSDCDFCHGTLEQHADMVSAVCGTMYQAPRTGSGIPTPVSNSPEFISYDDYPFRYVDMDFAGSTTICDDDWLFLIDHYEEAMDTTVMTAKEYGIPVHLYLQTFDDTLEAGEGRLVEFVDTNVPADIRVTSPDVFAIREDSTERTDRLVCTAGETITLGAVFYNMGTDSTGNIGVVFTKVGTPYILGTDTISFDGLSGYYSPDSTSASIQWETDAGDVGVHRIEISAGSVQGENTSDNSVTVTVLVEPVDYATEVLGNAWDMNEALSSPPDWFTSDIESVSSGWVDTCWTDSVSGMFEGEIETRNYGDWTGYRGDIYLNTDSGSIDADHYTMLSLAGVSLREDTSGVDFGCGMFLFWKDARETEYFLELHGSNGFGRGLGLGSEMWREFGPLDLSACTTAWSGEVHDLGIRFQMDPPSSFPIPTLGIRIGWVRLEEGAL